MWTTPGTQNRLPKTRMAPLTGRMSVGPVVMLTSKGLSMKWGSLSVYAHRISEAPSEVLRDRREVRVVRTTDTPVHYYCEVQHHEEGEGGGGEGDGGTLHQIAKRHGSVVLR